MSNRTRILVLFALLLVGATSMMAAPDHDIEWTYYTDSSKTEECGWKILTCGGGVYGAGCRTPWYTIYHWPPC